MQNNKQMNSNEAEEIKEEICYERAGNGKRFSAGLLDTFLSLLTGFILLTLTFTLINEHPGMQQMISKREEIAIDSKLYTKKDGTLYRFNDIILNDNSLTTDQKSDELRNTLDYFYANFRIENNNMNGVEIYHNELNNAKSNDGKKLFNEKYERALLSDDEDITYLNYYNDLFDRSTGFFLDNKEYASINRNIILIYSFSILLTIALPFIVFFYIVPMCFVKTYQTLGQFVCRIAVIDYTGLRISPIKFSIRFLFFFIFEVIGSMVTFFIPFAISFTMMVLSKTHQTLHDYLFSTYCVNLDGKTVYKNIFDYVSKTRKKEKDSLKIEDPNYQPHIED